MSDKIRIDENYWYEIVLWDTSDYLYHANLFKENPYNLIHTTGGYSSFNDCIVAIKAIIEFLNSAE